jgi:hypothetical protein
LVEDAFGKFVLAIPSTTLPQAVIDGDARPSLNKSTASL